jgi:uncharacterized protein YndB with AHSA1/START domain
MLQVTDFVAHYECDLPARADRVWQAWTEPAELAAWFWPSSFGTAVTFEGTSWRIAAVTPPMAASGTVLATSAPDLLVWSWRWDGEDLVTTVTIRLAPAGHGCHLAVDHAGFPDQQASDDHAVGWRDCLARLHTRLADERR